MGVRISPLEFQIIKFSSHFGLAHILPQIIVPKITYQLDRKKINPEYQSLCFFKYGVLMTARDPPRFYFIYRGIY